MIPYANYTGRCENDARVYACNKALCLLYTGNLSAGVEYLEGAIRADVAGLDEGLLSLSLSNLLYMENPYSYNKCQ